MDERSISNKVSKKDEIASEEYEEMKKSIADLICRMQS
jgi:hypothetical protein